MFIINHRCLSIAFTLSILLLFDNLLIKGIVIFLSLLYHYQFMKNHVLYLLVLFILFSCMTYQNEKIMDSNIVRIDEIRDSYVIASNGSDKCILYNVNGVSLYSIIQIEGNYESVSSTKNRNTFQFDTYLKRKGIYSSMYVKSYKTITESKHIKAKLFNHINNIEDVQIKDYLNAVLYRNNESENDYAYFIYASGLHISFMASLLSRLLKTNYHKVAIIISFMMLMLLPVAAYMYRILIFSLIPLLFKQMDRKDQLGISIIVLYFIDCSIIYEISFLIPVAFKIIQLFNVTKVSKKITQLLVLVPIQLYFFHECNLMSVLLFPFIRRLNGLTFLFSLTTIITKSFYPFLKGLVWIQEQILSFLPYSYKIIGKPFLIWMIAWVCLSILLISYKQKKHIFLLIALIIFQWNMKLMTPFGEVTFIDVGQGDCILIREPLNGQVMLIDVAGKINQNLAKSIIYPVLKSKGIKTIDKIVISHDDYDHSGGLDDLKKLISVNEIITEPENIQLKYIHLYAYQYEFAKDENDKSIVLFSTINKLNYLFMGDASIEVEKVFIDQYNQLDIDVLKVGHHGSKTSSSLSFIHQIRPLISVISSGRNNRYRHPHEEVIDILKKENSLILNTQTQGSISVYFHPLFNFLISGDNTISFIH